MRYILLLEKLMPLDTNSKEFIAQKKFLENIVEGFKKNIATRKTINILGISCSSVNKDDNPRRVPSSEKILLETLAYAKKSFENIEIKTHILREMKFGHCEANYSIQGSYCTRPCWLSQRKKDDELINLYNNLTDRSDIVLIATPIRRGNPSSLYFKLIERLNCIENQKEVYGVDLIHHQQVGFIIIGAQDGVQHTLGTMAQFWLQLGFSMSKYPFVGFTTGGYTNKETDKSVEKLFQSHQEITEQYKTMIDNQIISVRKLRGKGN